MVGQGSGVDGDGGDVGGYGGADAQRGVLYDEALVRPELAPQHGAALGKSHQVGLRVGLALLDVEACDHALRGEDVRVVLAELGEQRGGAAACDKQNHHALGLHLADEGECARHGLRVRVTGEVGRLDAIHLVSHLARCRQPLPLGKNLYGAKARAPLVHVGLLLAEVEAEVGHGEVPRLRMVGHGVEQHAIHVEKDCGRGHSYK